jgi:hypothetical protein
MNEEVYVSRPRYRWPWFVLGAVILGVVLTVLWMSVEVRRVREQKTSNLLMAPNPTESSNAK